MGRVGEAGGGDQSLGKGVGGGEGTARLRCGPNFG